MAVWGRSCTAQWLPEPEQCSAWNAWRLGLFSGLQMSCQRVSSSKCGDLSGIAKSRARNWASPKTLDRSCSWGPFPTASKDGHLETFLAASETWLWSSLVLRVGLPPSTGFSRLRLLQSRHHGNALYQTTAWALWCRALADPQRTVFSTLIYSQIHLALLRVALWCVVLEIGL